MLFRSWPLLRSILSFPLPDLPVRWGSGKDQVLNLGRDEKGVRREGHLGKQILEIGGWLGGLISAFATFYSKANPVFTEIFEQLWGAKPTKFGPFLKDRGYFRGMQKPWEGARPGSLKEYGARLKSIISRFVPFGLRKIITQGLGAGISHFVASAFGSYSIAKQYTPWKAADDVEAALLNKDKQKGMQEVEIIKGILRDNKFDEKDIKQGITSVRNQLIKEGKLPDAVTLKNSEAKIKEALINKDTKALNEIKKELLDSGVYTSKGVISGISKFRNQLIKNKKIEAVRKKRKKRI